MINKKMMGKNQSRFKAMKAVYTYFFPEVRDLIHSTDGLDSRLFLTSTTISRAQSIVDSMNFQKRLVVPKTSSGRVDLDSIHEPAIERILEIYEKTVPGISEFPYRYFTSGSSEGVFHVMSELKANGTNKIYTFGGEYEGYKEYGKTLDLLTEEVDFSSESKNMKTGKWFISNPSARDGNIINNERINEICEEGNTLYLDLAYVGSTKRHKFDVSHENIKAVFLSFSKPYGIFRFRTGFTLSRNPVDSLYANKWFKDVSRVLAAVKIAEEIGPQKLHNIYGGRQKKIVNKINKEHGLNMKPSDALLLGNISRKDSKSLPDEQKNLITDFERDGSYRFCLTPYYEEFERGDKNER